MTRTITEIHTFTRKDLEQAAKAVAKSKVIGGYYVGEFGEQRTNWNDDGTLDVRTTHIPGERK